MVFTPESFILHALSLSFESSLDWKLCGTRTCHFIGRKISMGNYGGVEIVVEVKVPLHISAMNLSLAPKNKAKETHSAKA